MTNQLGSWDAPVQRPVRPAAPVIEAYGDVPWDDAVDLFLSASRLSEHTQFHVRYSLKKGRVKLFRQAFDLGSVAAWTPELTARFVVGITRSVDNPGGLARESAKTIRKHLMWFGAWYAKQEWGSPALASIPHLPLPGRTHADMAALAAVTAEAEEMPAFTKQEARILREAVTTQRDYLVVKLLTYTGVRPSEAAGLLLPNIHTEPRDARIRIVGSFWNPAMPKSPAGFRDIPLDIDANGLPRDFRDYLPKREALPTDHPFAFVVKRRDEHERYPRLTVEAIDKMLVWLGRKTHIHCNAYRFRHTFCTWCADAGVPEMQLATWMGHKDTTLIARYYRRRNNMAAIEAANRIRF